MPCISVIVPVYKVEGYLHRCVDSILAQSFKDFELILVDDGSPDRCGAFCDAYARKDSRIHVIHQKNGGLSAARNTGIDWVMKNSSSRWLTFVDSDDWVHSEFLAVLYRAAEETECKISACGFYRTGGEEIPAVKNWNIELLSADDYYCGNYHEGATPAACGKLYNRYLFKKLRYPVGKLHEDEFTTYLLLYEVGKIAVTPLSLYAYFQNPESITRSDWNPRRLHVLEAFEQQMQFAEETGNLRLLNKVTLQYIYSTYAHLEEAQKVYCKELRRKLRKALKMGQERGCFVKTEDTLWAYEAAYPCKPYWWLRSKWKR